VSAARAEDKAQKAKAALRASESAAPEEDPAVKVKKVLAKPKDEVRKVCFSDCAVRAFQPGLKD
jgi:hypothetical protein